MVSQSTANAAGTDQNPIPRSDRQFDLSPAWDTQFQQGRMYITHGFWGGLTFEAPPVSLVNLNQMKFCETSDISSCLDNDENLEVQGYATLCEKDASAFCIESVSFSTDGVTWVDSVFNNYWDMTPDARNFNAVLQQANFVEKFISFSKVKSWTTDANKALYASAPGPLMFEAPAGLSSAGATKYLVEPHFSQTFHKTQNGFMDSKGVNGFSLSVRPIVEVNSDDLRGSTQFTGYVNGQRGLFGTGGTYKDQYLSVNGRSAYPTKFNDDVRVRVVMRAPKTLGGWFHGRLDSPNIKIVSLNEFQNQVTVEAGSVMVPITHVEYPMFSKEGLDVVEKLGWPSKEELERLRVKDQNGTGGPTGGFWSTDTGVEGFKKWSAGLGDKSLGQANTWFLKKMNGLSGSPCLTGSDRLQGLISTNAMVYQPNLPTFSEGYLNYQVAGTHFDMAGDLQLGTYDLIVRSDAARCVYGYTSAPISATVTVTGSGDQSVETTVVSEKDGWLKLAAYGFTFSEKEIKVKLTQPITKTLSKFAGSSKALTAKQKLEIKTALAAVKLPSEIVCTVTYNSNKTKATALARAKSVCSYAKSLSGKHTYLASAILVTGSNQADRVTISTK